MRWLKIEAAAQEWCGGISAKTMYAAVRAGKLRVARIGAGRNMLVSEEFCTAWLLESAERQGAQEAKR